ncbi:MAG: hypothetical protein IJB79_08885 [Candidatus Gastranaerophilales bacterium]|nr:hypothetical protein [Candidatus Gastranaerophilales bacterium]
MIPNDEKIILLYQKELKLRSSIKFDFDIFVIILILTYLISYRLSSYIAIYKNVENKSGIEIGFLIIFFTLLFIPISNINQEDFSKQENRSLAKWEPFIKDGEINFEFGKNFDKWFNDRFSQRKNIIFIYNNLLNKLNKNYYKLNKIYFNKTTNWAYQYSWFMLNPVKNSEFNIYKNNIKKLYDFCNKNNIKLYILIPPGSGQIYPEEVKPFIVNNEKYKIEDFQNEINDYLKNDIVIYPFKESKEASKKDYIFPKSDPHWSEYGAFIGFECLMKRIKKDFPNLILPKTTDYNIKKHNQIITDFPHTYRLGYFYESLNIKELKESYITYQHKKEKELKTLKKENDTYLEDVFFPQGNDLKVYMVGSSFSENLFLFARYSFKNVYKRRYNAPSGGMELKIARWEEDILKIKPNILIITIQTNAINQFKELYKNEKESEK